MSWDYKRTEHGEYGSVPYREIKHKCPSCKKIRIFKRIDVNCRDGLVYCEGSYMPLYRCDKCWIIIGVGNKLDASSTNDIKDGGKTK